MKRSDMRYQITETLIEECGLDFLVMKPIDVAEEILKTIEAAGMLPPCCLDEIDHDGACKTEWEQENENGRI